MKQAHETCKAMSKKAHNTPWKDPPAVGHSTAQKVLEVCRVNPEEENSRLRILDFGCGKGRYMKVFESYVSASNLVGCDIDLEAGRSVRQLGLNFVLLSISFPVLPFKDAAFDIVFSSNVIEHIPHQMYKRYLIEVHRVLRPGGIFALGAPNYPIKRLYDIRTALRNPDYRWYYLLDDPTHCNKLSIFQVERDLQGLFCDVRLEPSELPFEASIPALSKRVIRYRLRLLGNKFFGSCVKR